MQIDTTRFGRIDVPEEAVIHFPRGLYGLESTRDYCLLKHDDRGCFHWLQAVDAPGIALVVADPFMFFPSYEVEIPDAAADLLQAAAASEVTIYTSITVAARDRGITANLLGPLIINPLSQRGLQLILDGARYSTQHCIISYRAVEEAA
jgi:flagellar assembly factor FliW